MAKWIKTELGNEVLKKVDSDTKETFHISYVKDFTGSPKSIAIFKKHSDPEETALVYVRNGERYFYILVGNFKNEFAKCKTIKECKQIYKTNEEYQHGHSYIEN